MAGRRVLSEKGGSSGCTVIGSQLGVIQTVEALDALRELRASRPDLVHDLFGSTWVGERLDTTERPGPASVQASLDRLLLVLPRGLVVDPGFPAVPSVCVFETDMHIPRQPLPDGA